MKRLVGLAAVLGSLRAEPIARDYFIRAHAQDTLANVKVEHVRVAWPPFWEVEVSADVMEPGSTTVAYVGAMRIWVEPITGYAFVDEQG
jgi:hypothetical protein